MTIAVCPGSYDPVTAGHLDVKGLRQNGDYEAELGMALVNRKLAGIETLFLPADPILEHISSSIVKDVARHACELRGDHELSLIPITEPTRP